MSNDGLQIAVSGSNGSLSSAAIADQLSSALRGEAFYSRGKSGPEVSALQQLVNLALIGVRNSHSGALTEQDLRPLSITGTFDARTEQVIKKLQSAFSLSLNDGSLVQVSADSKERGLSPDGIVGPRTSALLHKLAGGDLASKCQTFERFREITGGVWDISQVSHPILASDRPSSDTVRSLPADKVALIAEEAKKLNKPMEWYLATLMYESGLDPAARNKIGFTGLLQMSGTNARNYYREYGVQSTADVAKLSFEQQLGGVTQYFRDRNVGKLNSIEDFYLSVLYPAKVGKRGEQAVFSRNDPTRIGRISYRENSGMDENKDGVVSVNEATAGVKRTLASLVTPNPKSSEAE